ncbi:hypothetical protein [Pseudomonas sp. D(2018)]|uniref:hypothetical protein n=1 Tax=Pseudomonas sp. D(2018) TaxID=2502238 RepID=UPI0010F6D591|nr:hypothetical protein [Pseudomonas sp. D(2018)]
MSKRKPYNHRARLHAYFKAMLSSNHVAVVDAEGSGVQTLINWKKAALITSKGRTAIVDAVCDIPHHWCIYLAALCRDHEGKRYMKAVEVTPQGVYLAKDLEQVIETYSVELRDGCNPKHLQGMAWIAIPGPVSLEEAQADRIFDAVSAWPASSQAA